jgi:uncharacterized phage-associated protein
MATPKIDSIILANAILAKVNGASHLKLQKLLFYVQAWHLAYFEEPLINDEFEAWMHGPVSRKAWRHFKSHASPLVTSLKASATEKTEALRAFKRTLTREQIELIDDVLKEYGDKSAYYLECLTHAETPWLDARRGVAPDSACTSRISKESMKTFYKGEMFTTRT